MWQHQWREHLQIISFCSPLCEINDSRKKKRKEKNRIKLNKNNENKLTEGIVSRIWVQPGLFCFSSDCHHLFANTVPALSGQLWAQLQICLSSHLLLRYGNLGPLNLKQTRAKGRRFKPFYPQSDSCFSPSHGLWFKACHNNELSNTVYSVI